MSDVAHRVRKCVVRETGATFQKLEGNPTFTDLGADSLDMWELVMEVEDEFEIEIPDGMLPVLTSTTLNEYIQAVEKICKVPA